MMVKQFAFYVHLVWLFLLMPLVAENGWNSECWSLVGGFEAGVLVTSHAGKSKTFPGSPTDEFYQYSPHHQTQSRGVYGGFLGVAWRGLPDWDLQLDLKYSQSSSFSVHGTLTQGLDVQSQDTYSYRYQIAVRQLLAEARFAYVNCSCFRPYALVGIGSSFNKASSFRATVPDLLTFTRVYKSKTKVGFSYAVGAGVDIEITPCWFVGVNYRFTNLGKASLGSASIDGEHVSGTLSQSQFYANQFAAQLTFLY